MATTTDVQPQVRMIALQQIRHDANIRELASEDVDALAGSIELLGQITPAIVRADGDGYLLIAGHKRYAALKKLGHAEIRAEVRTGDGEHSERAAENIVRTQLNPYEEAQAVAAMLTNGLTEDGAAQALGWPKARVTARMRLLELPQAAQLMVGAGEIALSSVEQLRAIGQVSPALLDALIAYLADGNQFAAERLAREPGWVLDRLCARPTARCLPRTSAASTVTSSPAFGWARRPRRSMSARSSFPGSLTATPTALTSASLTSRLIRLARPGW